MPHLSPTRLLARRRNPLALYVERHPTELHGAQQSRARFSEGGTVGGGCRSVSGSRGTAQISARPGSQTRVLRIARRASSGSHRGMRLGPPRVLRSEGSGGRVERAWSSSLAVAPLRSSRRELSECSAPES